MSYSGGMRDVAALVLAGGKMGDYGVLTQNRAKAALPFAGTYRIIDFGLSSLRHSGVEQVGIIIQYLPSSLIEHVGIGQSWDLHGYGRTLKIMPPFVGIERIAWYEGTSDALFQNLNFILDLRPQIVIVLSGEHVYQLDFRDIVEEHRRRGAELTVVTKEMPAERRTSRFGYVQTDDDSRVRAYVEKPEVVPPELPASTGIYVFNADVFIELLQQANLQQGTNLAKDVISRFAPSLRAYATPMGGFWEYLENVNEYFDVQRDMMRDGEFELLRQWHVMTNLEYRGVGFSPPSLFGRESYVADSFVCAKCRIDGRVERSILSAGVRVEAGAEVEDCILMHDCVVGAGAKLRGVISDKDACFGAGACVGIDKVTGSSSKATHVSRDAGPLTLIGKQACISANARVSQGAQVPPGTKVDAFQVVA